MKRLCLAFLFAPLLSACGSGPGATPTAATGVPGGAKVAAAGQATLTAAALTFVSGETDQPVAGAAVIVGGQNFTTDGSGAITLSAAPPVSTQLEVNAAGFLKRETLIRVATDTKFTLWPDHSGFDQSFIQSVVYFPGFVIDGKLTRPTAGVALTLSADLANADSTAAITDAAAWITAANGQIPYTVTSAPAAGAIVIKMSVNAADSFFAQSPASLAVTKVSTTGNKIQSGEMVFKDVSYSQIRALVAHELGHTFGLGHPDPPGIMNAAVDASRTDYSDSEKLAMRMSLLRRPGNALPDNDRAVTTASASGLLVIGCGLRQ